MILNKLPNECAVRCTVWIHKDHKDYIEDLAYANQATQRDILNHIINEFKKNNPLKPLRKVKE